MKLSVIIPVFNTGKYLVKCLDSLINQTLDKIEFIFVDDGSTDNSVDIIKKYMEHDERIRLLQKENNGVAAARNYGLSEANGEYIAFLDSDDYVDQSMYKTLYDKAKEDNADIVICNYYFDYENRIVENSNKITDKESRIISPEEYITLTPSAWNKIIRKNYLEKCRFAFPEGMIYEDLVAIPLLGLKDPKVVYLNKNFYYYVQRDNSITRNKVYKSRYEDLFKAAACLYQKMEGTNYQKELEYVLVYHFLYLGSLNFYKYKRYDNIDKIADDMHKYAPRWYKNQLVKTKFSKKEIIYMKLFYYKKYFLINIYRRFIKHNEQNTENN